MTTTESSAPPIRWGVLGAGGIAATVGADIAASPGSTLAAVAARDAQRAAAFARLHGVARSYGSYEELVTDPDVDVVYVATTHAQHHEHALLALEAGKPVLVEKAFTLNAREARKVVAVARAHRLFCMEAMWMRFNPLIQEAQRVAASGRIGDVVAVRAELSRRFEYDPNHRLFNLEVGGGALLDLGVYPTTFAWLFLGRPDIVQATGSLAPTGSDATAALQWGYGDGRIAQVLSSAVSGSPFAGLVTGTSGWIQVGRRVHHPTTLTVHTAAGDEVSSVEIAGNGYGPQVAEVERCLRAGETESPLAPLDETVAILEILDEARRQLGVRYPADEA
ncbi:MAG: gfo/Idh/MocA family oxidoreductase [Pseudonocardiales bacterium]|nr:gfo/Idh/MocA family oxidoreductase [Pseudonocardiales bacterium]